MYVKTREVEIKEEILKAIYHLSTDRSKVLLWQTIMVEGKAKKNLIHCEMLGLDNKNLYFEPINVKTKELLSKKISRKNKIFIRGSHNGVLFKSENYRVINGIIEIPIPKKILLSEKRSANRIQISDTEHAYLKFEKNKNQHFRSTKMKIEDFSEFGFSVQLKKIDRPHYEVNGTYQISMILDIPIKGLSATLVYQRVQSYIKNGKTRVIYRAGFKLNQKLPNEIIKRLSKLSDNHKKMAA